MQILVLAIVAGLLGWFAMKRLRRAGVEVHGGRLLWVIMGAALALRVGLAAPVALRVALVVVAIAALAVWLHRRGHGGDGPDDGHDPPVDPEPDPGHGERVERLDPEAFDRARADWEHELKKPAAD